MGHTNIGLRLAPAWMAMTAAMAKKGVARRTKPRVRNGFNSGLGRGPGNTFGPSPPLAGLEVRRRQSVDAGRAIRPLLTEGALTYPDRVVASLRAPSRPR